jgi:hypothetical protein
LSTSSVVWNPKPATGRLARRSGIIEADDEYRRWPARGIFLRTFHTVRLAGSIVRTDPGSSLNAD